MNINQTSEVVDDFLSNYIEGANISSIIYDNGNKKWKITYGNNLNDDEFGSFEEMAMFLLLDQNQE